MPADLGGLEPEELHASTKSSKNATETEAFDSRRAYIIDTASTWIVRRATSLSRHVDGGRYLITGIFS
ncbi:MAG TPA: hypothetical protein VF331_01925 [Polyangiales bacterium]